MVVARRVIPRLGGLASSSCGSSTSAYPPSSSSASSALAATRALPTALRTPLARPFTTALARRAAPHTPSLADIEPGQAHVFDKKQAEFRDNLAELHRQKKEKEREAAREQDDSGKRGGGKSAGAGGRLSSLIYGTEEGREMDREIERSFSQILARGKYVHSITFHTVKPDKLDEYVALVGEWYPKVARAPENKVHLVGSWRTEVGDGDTFVHIWEYQRYSGYHASLHSIRHHPDYPAFDQRLRQLVTSRNTSLMQEFRFWPTSPPRQLGGIFELRSYTLHPGNLLEWETHWQKGLAARREVMEGVGAWFVQIGALNEVHHLWQFADLEERRARREKSWGVSGWADTVHKTVPLIQTMKSRIMVPMPWSPVG